MTAGLSTPCISSDLVNHDLGFGAMYTSAAFLATIVCLVVVAHRRLRGQNATA